MLPPQDENWKIKNSINIEYFLSSFESLFVLCSFIAARSFSFLSFVSSLAFLAPMVKIEKKGAAKKTTTKRWEKENKFHGIFLALLLRKNCFVYEFAIHKTFLLPFFAPRFFYWKIMSFVYENSARSWKFILDFSLESPFFIPAFISSLTVFRYKCWIHESWYRDIPLGYLQPDFGTQGAQL